MKTDLDQKLFSRFTTVGGVDEVGRGCLAGPACVGIVVASKHCIAPPGLADSKVLTPKKREALFEAAGSWAIDTALGWVQAREIDEIGIVPALRLAAFRALEELADRGNLPQALLLDGTHNYLQPPQIDLFTFQDQGQYPDFAIPPVFTQAKADGLYPIVSAASIRAKVARDHYMQDLADEGYGFAQHKGYGSAKHVEAISRLGLSPEHRRSFKLKAFGQENGMIYR